ncbi:hypothetical protein [Streptomyces sp. NRRL S-646]|uniref:hypothetical protein n=1 Tax=Streptomyces sp. NRRL S-646 TaxID=1463917 RepID=UPI0004C72400|nr:hypothetical protein [Streptomyces sp. NRRL S-646]
MQRKAYVSGVAAFLVALLAGCTGGSGGGGATDDANPGEAGTASVVAQPGKYRTLPGPCSAVSHDTLDSLLPGIKQIADADQQEKAYEGDAALAFDNDRKAGCRWKVDSTAASDRLMVDFERVVSYDNSVSDDTQAQELFAEKETAADLPEPTSSDSDSSSSSSSGSTPSASASSSPTAGASSSASVSPSGSESASSSAAPANLQPRTLDDLGDEAFLDDALSGSGSTARQRTVTVVFRTSNVIVTIEYEEQPAAVGVVPDSEEMQDRARNLAAQLADTLGG